MADEVDGLIAAWRRELPGEDVEAMQVWSRIHRLSDLLDAARRESFARHGLESWEFDVLAALRRSGEPYRLSPGALTRETHVTSGTMTNRVDRLVARGLVNRESHPEDGRGVIVSLTPAGRKVVDSSLLDLLATEDELLSGIPGVQQEQLVAALRHLLTKLGAAPASS